MNERIKELMDQAVQLVADEYTKGDVSRLNTDSHYVEDLINVKFAELIVQECVRQIGDLMDFTDYPDDTEKSMVELKTLRDARQVIKEHFGVK